MIAIPAVDLRGGRCVQLVGGRPEEERVSLPDPLAVARRWRATGFGSLHVVDLDAALGDGDNADIVGALVDDADVDLQVGGGIRNDDRADALLHRGVDRIVVGTRALDDPDWLLGLAQARPGRVVVAVDTRNGVILRKGWTESTGVEVTAWLADVAGLPLAGILSTDVGREGRLAGIDRDGCARVVAASPHPVCISGGITTVDELAFLEEAGAAAAVLGMALYTDTLNGSEVARRWGAAADGSPVSWTDRRMTP
jgi:phosphoribosylformimino-5-aminoimidazole carboxamide ribotide isomerase